MRDGVAYDHAPEGLDRQVGEGIGRVDSVIVAERMVVARLAAIRRARDILDLQAALNLQAFQLTVRAPALEVVLFLFLFLQVPPPNGLAVLYG